MCVVTQLEGWGGGKRESEGILCVVLCASVFEPVTLGS